MTVYYRGSGQYCYANSLSMALKSIGEDYDPSFLECATSVAVSAFIDESGLLFFSSRFNAPDRGILVALQNLGLDYQHYYCLKEEDEDGRRSFQKLEQFLQNGSVVVGPLDMGKLLYLPNHPYLGGVDHYVAVYKMDTERVYLHDPAGYPFMSMTRADFAVAWKAESISYRIGSYSMWGHFRKMGRPDRAEIVQKTAERISEILQSEKQAERVGPLAIRELAAQIEDGQLSNELKGHLSFFSFQLGAKRCSDFAAFFASSNAIIAKLKVQQGEQFGAAHVALMKEDWQGLNRTLMKIADIEEEFQRQFL